MSASHTQAPNAPAPTARSPFDWMHASAQPRLLALLTGVTLALSVWLSVLGAALTTEVTPQGIVSFELAGTAAAAQAVIGAWDARAREAAMLVQGVDFLFLVAYPLWFSLASLRLGRRLGGVWQRAGQRLAWAVLLAAPLDVIENLALIRQLEFGASDAAARIAWASAVPKFALVAVATVFVASASALALVDWLRGRSTSPG